MLLILTFIFIFFSGIKQMPQILIPVCILAEDIILNILCTSFCGMASSHTSHSYTSNLYQDYVLELIFKINIPLKKQEVISPVISAWTF